MKIEEQYARIFRYCYFHIYDKSIAEDMTQEVFLRFYGSGHYQDEGRQIQYLYTIARNLCAELYRKRTCFYSMDEAFDVEAEWDIETELIRKLTLRAALKKLSTEERELLFLRYVNEVPIPVICRLFSISRFALYRRLKKILAKLRNEIGEESDG